MSVSGQKREGPSGRWQGKGGLKEATYHVFIYYCIKYQPKLSDLRQRHFYDVSGLRTDWAQPGGSCSGFSYNCGQCGWGEPASSVSGVLLVQCPLGPQLGLVDGLPPCALPPWPGFPQSMVSGFQEGVSQGASGGCAAFYDLASKVI